MLIKKNNFFINQGHIIITLACNLSCEHCLFRCGPSREWMPPDIISKAAEEYYQNNIKNVRIMGGEPFLDLEKFETALNIIKKFYKSNQISTITSGFWAADRKKTEKILNLIKGIRRLDVSVDRFHQKKVPIENVYRILESSKRLDIKVHLRLMLDSKSSFLLQRLIDLINRFSPEFSVCPLDFKGRAENFDISINKNYPKFESYLLSKTNIKKNSYQERNFQKAQLFLEPSVFPSGNAYSCCDALKLTYMGNINNESLSLMLIRATKSLPSKFLSIKCKTHKFLSPKDKDKCEICRNQPLIENILNFANEWIGREYLSIHLDESFDNILKKILKKERQILIFFELNEKNLNSKAGNKILKILKQLKENKIKFKVSRSVPPCILNCHATKNFGIPYDCYECNELFTVKEGFIHFCNTLKNKKGPKFDISKDRKYIYNFFVREHDKLPILKKCKSCIYFIRNSCNGMCFRGKTTIVS